MAARYRIPHLPETGIHRTECCIQRSRFITTSAHCSSTELSRAFIEQVRQEFADATHNCWAFAAGAPGQSAYVGFSDDGEPHGTAGRPMLTVLLHSDIGEIACVVTRYFGGIKLGTGGLVRAYQGCVQENLLTIPTCERIETSTLTALIAYGHVESFRRLLPLFEAKLLHEEFAADVSFSIKIPDEHIPAFTVALNELTNGAALLEPTDPPQE